MRGKGQGWGKKKKESRRKGIGRVARGDDKGGEERTLKI